MNASSKVTVSFSISPDVLEWVETQAKEEDRSKSYFVNEILKAVMKGALVERTQNNER